MTCSTNVSNGRSSACPGWNVAQYAYAAKVLIPLPSKAVMCSSDIPISLALS